MALALTSFAFAPVPKESAKVLKVTRGKSFYAGAVFINGKYIEPPYVVERWGTGIRINGHPVTGQVIDWNEFLKAQPNVRATKQEPVAEPASAASAPVASTTEEVTETSLDDLFDDTPKVEKKAPAAPAVQPKQKKVAATYSLEGEFVPNEATKKMLGRINAVRTEIDRTLRTGGFICFGNAYSQVSGDARTLMSLMERLPEFQKNARDEQDFCARVREAGLVYLNEVLRMDLYRNRVDYRKLLERRTRLKRDADLQKLLNDVSSPLL